MKSVKKHLRSLHTRSGLPIFYTYKYGSRLLIENDVKKYKYKKKSFGYGRYKKVESSLSKKINSEFYINSIHNKNLTEQKILWKTLKNVQHPRGEVFEDPLEKFSDELNKFEKEINDKNNETKQYWELLKEQIEAFIQHLPRSILIIMLHWTNPPKYPVPKIQLLSKDELIKNLKFEITQTTVLSFTIFLFKICFAGSLVSFFIFKALEPYENRRNNFIDFMVKRKMNFMLTFYMRHKNFLFRKFTNRYINPTPVLPNFIQNRINRRYSLIFQNGWEFYLRWHWYFRNNLL